MLIPSESILSKEAKARLQAIFEFSELGSSFRLATRDLEIRGAGNLLGSSQSGHISAVGLDLYTQLMEETVRELKGEDVIPVIDPEINLSIPAFIPEDYIENVSQRLVVYKRLTSCQNDAEVKEIEEELDDRFGSIPHEVYNLLRVISFKNFLRQLRITSVDYNGKEVILTFHSTAENTLDKILALIEKTPQRFKLTPEGTMRIGCAAGNWNAVIDQVKTLLQ
jgi:transcription-repair coupling factor (superfamily II helicase)